MEAYVRENPSVTLRKVNIDEWQSPVARQYGIRSIPHLLLYRDGTLEAEGKQAVLQKLR